MRLVKGVVILNPQNLKRAMFWSADKGISGGDVLCELCPHFCRLGDGQTGFCKVRKNIGGVLYSLNYGVISSIAIDPIEKKPLYRFYPGSSILSIGSVGCNFACQFCQNYTISKEFELHPEINVNRYERVDPQDIIDLTRREGLNQIAFTYNEPTVFYELVYETAILAKKANIRVVLVTNGFINEEPFLKLMPYIDGMNIDVKTYDEGLYRKKIHGGLEPVLQTIKLAVREGIHLEVTCLVVPNLFEDEKLSEGLFSRLYETAGDVVLHLSRYFPRYHYDEPATDIQHMMRLQKVARKYFTYVYLGNI